MKQRVPWEERRRRGRVGDKKETRGSGKEKGAILTEKEDRETVRHFTITMMNKKEIQNKRREEREEREKEDKSRKNLSLQTIFSCVNHLVTMPLLHQKQ